jgi:hypothetical protein
MAVFQDEVEFAVRDGLKLKDAVNIDDGRSMNADEAHGFETIELKFRRVLKMTFLKATLGLSFAYSGRSSQSNLTSEKIANRDFPQRTEL